MYFLKCVIFWCCQLLTPTQCTESLLAVKMADGIYHLHTGCSCIQYNLNIYSSTILHQNIAEEPVFMYYIYGALSLADCSCCTCFHPAPIWLFLWTSVSIHKTESSVEVSTCCSLHSHKTKVNQWYTRPPIRSRITCYTVKSHLWGIIIYTHTLVLMPWQVLARKVHHTIIGGICYICFITH
jgi:hypothetical protein